MHLVSSKHSLELVPADCMILWLSVVASVMVPPKLHHEQRDHNPDNQHTARLWIRSAVRRLNTDLECHAFSPLNVLLSRTHPLYLARCLAVSPLTNLSKCVCVSKCECERVGECRVRCRAVVFYLCVLWLTPIAMLAVALAATA